MPIHKRMRDMKYNTCAHSNTLKNKRQVILVLHPKAANNVISGECEIGSPSQQDGERVRMNGLCNGIPFTTDKNSNPRQRNQQASARPSEKLENEIKK